MSLNNTTDLLKHQSGEEPERLYIAAGNIWGIMLSVAVVVSVLAIAGGAYMLFITFWDQNANDSQSGAPQNLNRNELTKMVKAFSAREQNFLALQSASSSVADPSK